MAAGHNRGLSILEVFREVSFLCRPGFLRCRARRIRAVRARDHAQRPGLPVDQGRHYRGTFPDSGKEFDSSYKRGEPTEFPLNGVIPCWTEGVQKMKPGGKAKLTCPPSIAYGSRGAGGVIPPNATLNFEVELISVTKR